MSFSLCPSLVVSCFLPTNHYLHLPAHPPGATLSSYTVIYTASWPTSTVNLTICVVLIKRHITSAYCHSTSITTTRIFHYLWPSFIIIYNPGCLRLHLYVCTTHHKLFLWTTVTWLRQYLLCTFSYQFTFTCSTLALLSLD